MTIRIISRTLRLAVFLMAIAGAPAALVAATLEPVDIFALELALDPQISPDGKLLSFIMPVAAPPRSFGTMPSPPPGAHWKPGAMVFDQALYRHDGAGYVQPGHYHLFVVPADGGVPRQITTGPFNHGGPDSLGRAYAWMPDSTALVTSAARKSEPEILHRRYNNGLYLVPLDGGGVAPIIDRSGPEISPAVSPDGKHIAYVGFDDEGRHYQVVRLYVIDRDGGDRRVLSADRLADLTHRSLPRRRRALSRYRLAEHGFDLRHHAGSLQLVL